MSIEALNWAWRQQTPNPTSKLVLMALADHANGDGECWPSMKRIAVMAQVSSRQVSYHITMLAKLGLLEKASRRRHQGQLRGWNYRLATSGSVLPVASGSSAYPPAEAGFRSEPSENRQVEPLATASRERPRDVLFETVADVCGYNLKALTKTARGRLNAAVKELRDIQADPDQIVRFAPRWKQTYPDATLTPQAITGNWAALAPTAAPSTCQCGQLLDYHDTEVHDMLTGDDNA
jgi:hypothetical protein